MKTTVELSDKLLIAAKKRAAELRRPLRRLIEDGLKRELASTRSGKRSGRRKVRWVVAQGGLPPGVDISDRAAMHNWLRRRK